MGQGPQLLEAIGAVSPTESKKAISHGSNYQECVTMPLSKASDNLAVWKDENGSDSDVDIDKSDHIFTCVDKVNSQLLFLLTY